MAVKTGQADKLLKIKASEADAEAKRLAGVGAWNEGVGVGGNRG